MQNRWIELAVRDAAAVTKYYIEHICGAEAKRVIHAHDFLHRGRVDTVCYLTSAAFAWLISGRDVAAPFSGVWDAPNETSGAHSVIAYSTDATECFEDMLEHVLIVYADICVMDSHFMHRQPFTMHPLSRLQEFDGLESRRICFDSAPNMDRRLAAIISWVEPVDLLPPSRNVLAKLNAPQRRVWELIQDKVGIRLADKERTCYFQSLDGSSAGGGVCELALTVDGDFMARFPFGCVVFDPIIVWTTV